MTEAGQSPGYFRYAIASLITGFTLQEDLSFAKPLIDRLKVQVHNLGSHCLYFPSWVEGKGAGEGLVFYCTSLCVPPLT